MTNTHRISQKEQKRIERERRAAERLTKRAIDKACREIGREQLRQACKAPPPEFQTWGVHRTRAWLAVAAKANQAVKQLNPSCQKTGDLFHRLARVAVAPIDALTHIIDPKA